MEEMMNLMGSDLLGMLGENGNVFLAWTRQMLMIALIVTIVIGLAICFFGLKIVRVLTAIVGLVVGAVIGGVVALMIGLNDTALLAVIGVSAVIVAVLFAWLRRLGIFFLILFYVFGVCASLVGVQPVLLLIIYFVVALVLAVLSVFWTTPLVIIVTGLEGGVSAGLAIASLAGLNQNVWIGYGISILIALIGMWVQFMMQSRKVGKKEKVYSRKVKEEVSRESEVEKARMMLEDEEDEEDEEDVFEDPEEVKKVPKENDTEDEEDDDIEIFNTEEL